ncbi:hypothetical protein Pfo_007974 [Paulownia fortunei]|nr:hypothetical protein Pfo_007974 [Paulownia fortunei]
MLNGETEFDALKYIFQEKTTSKSGPDDNKIIEISSDYDVDEGMKLLGTHRTLQVISLPEMCNPGSFMSRIVQVRNEMKVHDEVGSGRHSPCRNHQAVPLLQTPQGKQFETCVIMNSVNVNLATGFVNSLVEKAIEIDFANILRYTVAALIAIPDGRYNDHWADDEGEEIDAEDWADSEEGVDNGAHGADVEDEQLDKEVSYDEVPRDDEAGPDDEPSSGVEDGFGVEN